MTSNNVAYQNELGAKHYKDFTPLYNFGKSVAIGRYGSLASEYLKKTQPLAYKEYSEYSEFKYILAGINELAAEKLAEAKTELKKKHPSPETDDFFKLAEHNKWIENRAEEIVLKEIVYQPHISDSEVLRANNSKHSRVLH